MVVLLNDIVCEIQKILQGNLNYGHWFTFFVGSIFLIVGCHRLKQGFAKGFLTIISTLFYVFAFCITANNYATTTSVSLFLIVALVLQFLTWTIAEKFPVKKSFQCLWFYLLMLIPVFAVGLLQENGVPLSDLFCFQVSFLLTSAFLDIAVPALDKYQGGNTPESEIAHLTGNEQSVDTTSMSDFPSD